MTLMCGDRWLETGSPFAEGDMSESQIEWLKAENSRLMKQVEQLIKMFIALIQHVKRLLVSVQSWQRKLSN